MNPLLIAGAPARRYEILIFALVAISADFTHVLFILFIFCDCICVFKKIGFLNILLIYVCCNLVYFIMVVTFTNE